MATPVPKITEGLDTHLMCPIHLEMLKRPKTLPCQHVVCEECIEKWIATRGGVLYCPECHIQQPLPLEGARGLPNNFKLASLCEFVESLKVKSDHPEVAACEEHLKKAVAKICLHCNIPVCDECVLSSHKAHKTVAIEEFLKTMGNPLPKLVGQAKNKLKGIFASVEVLEKTRAQLRENYALVKRESDDHVHKLMKQITQAHVKLKSDIETKYSEKEATLIAQLESLSNARAEISELLKLQEESEGEESMSKSIMTASGQQLWNKLSQLPQQNLQLVPQENGLLSVQWDSNLAALIQKENLGSIVTKAVPSSSHSTLSLSSSRADVQSKVKIQVALQDAVGCPVDSTDISSLTAKVSAPGGSSGQLQFGQGDGGDAEAVFTPKDIGKYKIEAQLFGSPVKNSPLNLIIKPRGKMQINERGNLNSPHDIIEHDDNFYVADKGNNQVVILDKQFNFVGKFRTPSDTAYNKIEPYALAFTGRTFVVTDLKNHCVLEFSNSVFLQRFGQDVLTLPTGVACDKTGKVYVADGKKSCIYVFDHLRENIATLGGPGSTRGQFKNPWFIDVNSKGEVVVADFGNHRIQVINPDKNEVTGLIDVHVEQKVWDIRGLAVDRNDNILVTVRQSGNMRGWSTEHVFAYSPEGVFLGRFGEGFNYVRGMTIIEKEENTFALVVDGANHRIKGYLL